MPMKNDLGFTISVFVSLKSNTLAFDRKSAWFQGQVFFLNKNVQYKL